MKRVQKIQKDSYSSPFSCTWTVKWSFNRMWVFGFDICEKILLLKARPETILYWRNITSEATPLILVALGFALQVTLVFFQYWGRWSSVSQLVLLPLRQASSSRFTILFIMYFHGDACREIAIWAGIAGYKSVF